MLFDRRLGHLGAELLNVGGHSGWPDSVQPQAALLAPIQELPDGQGIGHPGVALANVGGEELWSADRTGALPRFTTYLGSGFTFAGKELG